jgi:hypothetical protein
MRFTDFEDPDLRIRVPSYLSDKKGNRYFSPLKPDEGDQVVSGIAVELISEREEVDEIESELTAPRHVHEGASVQLHSVRQGATVWVEGGTESLLTNHNRVTGKALHEFSVIFPLNDRYVHITIAGAGDIHSFDEYCRQIAASVEMRD